MPCGAIGPVVLMPCGAIGPVVLMPCGAIGPVVLMPCGAIGPVVLMTCGAIGPVVLVGCCAIGPVVVVGCCAIGPVVLIPCGAGLVGPGFRSAALSYPGRFCCSVRTEAGERFCAFTFCSDRGDSDWSALSAFCLGAGFAVSAFPG